MLVHVQCTLVHLPTSNSDLEHGGIIFCLKKLKHSLVELSMVTRVHFEDTFFLASEAQEFSSFHNIHCWCAYSNIDGTLGSLSAISEGVYLVQRITTDVTIWY